MGSVEPASKLADHGSAVPAQASSSQSGRVRVQDADRYREFTGFLLHAVSTEVLRKPQWLEIELWKVTDGTCRYVLHFIGKSVLYHDEGSPCNTGVPTQAGFLPTDSEPCRRCRPGSLQSLPPKAMVEAEIDRHKVEVCDGRPRDDDGSLLEGDDAGEEERWVRSAREVLRNLRESWHRRPELAGNLSAPAQRLLDTAARLDPAIRTVMTVVEEL